MGFNAQTEVYENLVKAGVIDPTKVVRTALQDAASVAGLLITTEAAVSEMPEDKPAMPMGGGGNGRNGRNGLLKSDARTLSSIIGRAGGAIAAGPSSLAACSLSISSASSSWSACSAVGAGGRSSLAGGEQQASRIER